MTLIGVDGCKYGWVAASLQEERVRLFRTARQLVAAYPKDALFLIDIPIGLDSAKCIGRTCESDTRKLLAPGRKSSVFPVPCREAVFSDTYREATAINQKILSKGIPIQSWHICLKIAEVDTLLRQVPALRTRVRESHPELAFQVLKGGAVTTKKKAAAGFDERIDILQNWEPAVTRMVEESMKYAPRKDVAKDDILDALCLAVTLKRLVEDGGIETGYPTDAQGIGMHMHVPFPACPVNRGARLEARVVSATEPA